MQNYTLTKLAELNLSHVEFLNLINKNPIYDYSNAVYISPNHPLQMTCMLHNSLFKQLPHRLLNNIIACTQCADKYRGSLRIKYITVDAFLKTAAGLHGDTYQYNLTPHMQLRSGDLISINCKLHGDFKQRVVQHLKGRGCRECGIIKCSNSNRHSADRFIQQANVLHDYKYSYNSVDYKNSMTHVTIICPVHGEFRQTPDNHLRGNRRKPNGCPKCKTSAGENKIRECLQLKCIDFIEQYRFENCKNIKPLPFDFYIPAKQLCIEYDGEQHFKPIPRGTQTVELAAVSYRTTQYNDTIKNNFCISNGIGLIRIPYHEYDNIEQLLSDL